MPFTHASSRTPATPSGKGFYELASNITSAGQQDQQALQPRTGSNPVFRTGIATVFGRNLDGSIDTQDNGIGAWGANTRDPNLVGVSLPISLLKQKFGGSHKKAKGALVEVVNPNTGARIIAPVVDVGPAAWTGHSVDLTPAAAKQLGSTGRDQMQYRFVDGDTPEYFPGKQVAPSIPATDAPAQPQPQLQPQPQPQPAEEKAAAAQPASRKSARYNIPDAIDSILAPQRALSEWNAQVKEFGQGPLQEAQQKEMAALDQKMAEHQKAIALLTAQSTTRDQSALRTAIDGAFRFFSPA